MNQVWVHKGSLLVSGTELRHVLKVRNEHIDRFALIPEGTHNVRPFRAGILANHTQANQIIYMSRLGRFKRSFPIRTYDEADLVNSSLPADHARQAFGRGLCVWEDEVVIGGSSPATISAFNFGTGERLACVNITMDVRNAVHGLEIWPY